MSTISSSLLRKVKYLYLSKQDSAQEVANELKTSIDAVYYFLRKYQIPRRTAKEQNKIRFANKRLSFKIKTKLSIAEEKLKIAGLMLYWGEGSQWQGEKIVDFANSNAEMVELFLVFLRRIFSVDESRLRCYLYCYINQDTEYLSEYWSAITKIPKKQFTKPYIRRDFNPEKKDKMNRGLIHIRYGDKKLLLILREEIKKMYEQLNNH